MTSTSSRVPIMTLRDFNNKSLITFLRICGVACPAGREFRHNTESEDDEEYCDFAELPILKSLWDLNGAVDEKGLWNWDGKGGVYDEHGNVVYNVRAGWARK